MGEPSVKICLLGDTGVGKSSLALRFVSNEFKPYSEATIGASFMTKTVEVEESDEDENEDGEADEPRGGDDEKQQAKEKATKKVAVKRNVNFKIWDTAGQEKYRSLAPMYYRGASAAILVYDICNRVSFETLQSWVTELRTSTASGTTLILVVCGNKYDLRHHRQVDATEGEEYASSIGAAYFETSARDDVRVSEVFEYVAKKVPKPTLTDFEATGLEKSGQINLGLAEEKPRSWLSFC